MLKDIFLKKIKKRNIFIHVLVILISSSFLIIINYFTLKVLAANRAYISGASLYASAQKDASRHLVTYLFSKDIAELESFNKELQVPLGDKDAREALMRNADLQTIHQAFIAGRNNPKDFKNLIWLFRNFQSFSLFNDAIKDWEQADSFILQLNAIGNELHQQLVNSNLNENDRNTFLRRINILNNELDVIIGRFSGKLIDFDRGVKNNLFLINIFLTLIIIICISTYYVFLVNRFKSAKLKTELINTSLRNANRELDKFVYSASHDLRSPISSLKGLIEIVKGEQDIQQIRTYLGLMSESLDKQDQFIQDIIDYSRNKKAQINIESVSLENIIDEAISQNKFLQKSRKIAVFKKLTIDYIESDALKLKIIINNLYTNGIKYYDAIKQKPCIALNAFEEEDSYVLVIEDNGIGIKKGFLNKIFDMFFVTDNNNKGSGLGLYLVKDAVEHLKGKIKVKSEFGVGTQFIISLPKKYDAKR